MPPARNGLDRTEQQAMSKPFIVLGDKIDHGGAVVSGSPATDIQGAAVARIGDKVACSQHGPTVIASGDPTLIIDGQPVARHGDKTACGATLIAGSQFRVTVESGGGGHANAGSASRKGNSALATDATRPVRYDEQIQFVNANGAGLPDVDYSLYLEDGRVVTGRTDDEGKTHRVTTEQPTAVIKAELTPSRATCCTLHAELAVDSPPLVVMPSVTTNANAVGSSVQLVQTPRGHSRRLTAGEIAMARLVFSDSIDYSKVKVHKGEYLWFGMQPDDTAMTPNGEIYFNERHFLEDFSSARVGLQQWFMHEMTHVWQFQLGYPVKLRGAIRVGLSYAYELIQGRELADFNMEAQGNVLADYFLLKFKASPGSMYEERYASDARALSLFEAVLAKFLLNPKDPTNLP